MYITSNQAYKNDKLELPRLGYTEYPITKHLGELAIDSLPNNGSRLIILTTAQASDTLLGDAATKEYTVQPASVTPLSAQEVGKRIARAIDNPLLASGSTEWVGTDEVIFYLEDRTSYNQAS